MYRSIDRQIRKHRLLTISAIGLGLWMNVAPADAGSPTKIYQAVPSADELSQDLFGHKTPMKTRGVRTSIGAPQAPKTRGIRWHEEQVAAQTPPPVAVAPVAQVATDTSLEVEPVQTASLDQTAPTSEKLAFNIQFHFNSTEIMAESTAYVDRLGEVLNAPDNRGSALMIVGHTDATGSASYNWQLSMQRAAAIRDYLVRVWRIDPATLTIDARGEYEPLSGLHPNDPTNRRVEFWALNG